MANSKRKCAYCQDRFKTELGIVRGPQFFCSSDHLISYAGENVTRLASKHYKKKETEFNAETVRRKKELNENDRSHQTKITQNVFNKWVRTVRDAGHGCISCDTEDFEGGHGGAWDCGHFLSRGAAGELKLTSLNAHKQCKKCNGGSGKHGQFNNKSATVAQEYERRLVIKIGQDKVDWLKGPHKSPKYTCEQLKEIRAYYAKLTRDNNPDDSGCPHVEKYVKN